jgi:hypothetical protein
MGDGQNRPQIDARPDFVGRVFVRPFAAQAGHLLQHAQIGFGGRYGVRDASMVAYDVSPITTAQGFALWNPTYKDSVGHTEHIIPSGEQRVFGGELRLPIWRAALQAEAHYVNNDTREAIDGFQETNTERLGGMKGVGWYATLSLWAWGDTFISGDPGFVRPVHVDLSQPPEKIKKGIEVLAVVSGVNATYDGASRGGKYDAKTPGASGVGTKIDVLQIGAGVNFWYTKNCRLMLNYMAYETPNSLTPNNLATVPGNLGSAPDTNAHVIHELGGRIALAL